MKTKYLKIGTRHAHRVIAEIKIGRKLRRGEVVHHIDGDSHNNDPENLEVLPNQAEHARHHFKGVKRKPKIVCKFGHDLSGSNVMITSIGRRRCLKCKRLYDNAWKKRKRKEKLKLKRGTP